MSGHESSYTPTNGFTRWLDTRLPIIRFAQDTAINFPTPKNLNYWWTFGGILAVCLATQIITGIILAMHYEASVDGAFASVERIMRDVPYGWLLRYIHANGASMFFLAVYIHMFRGLYYGSYKAPREVLWILGCVIYLLMMATAFLGYMLPWGQMSYHGSNVITGLFGAIPLIGESIQTWLMGGPSIGNQTLQRFFSLHYLLPFMIAAVVILHVWALHVPGNNNPTGVEVQDVEKETVPFHPYYTVKDAFAIVIFLIMFAVFVFYAPNVLGHADNYVEANPLVTPSHIVPEWYLLPFYAILRAITFDLGPIPAKLLGVIFMFAAIAVLFVLPWLDTSKVKSMRYRPVAKQFFFGFVAVCLLLGWCGAADPDGAVIPALQGESSLVVSYSENGAEVTSEYKGGGEAYHDAKSFMESLPEGANPSLAAVPAPTFQFRHLSLILTFCYFGFFILLFFLGLTEKPKEVPESIHKSVLKRHKASTATAIPAE
ncbi:cytochrome b N-terminal domain-containing protein [uncultured Hyphomonas sp.]|uniref:cytochrome b n=1 Tax=uncultured Hyphomonas sp. TaxID=225298 RepID=UPI002AABDBAD|nr:cytochrome b N-terminal domain-containing protein [uncultured Hyphomonas sp.]